MVIKIIPKAEKGSCCFGFWDKTYHRMTECGAPAVAVVNKSNGEYLCEEHAGIVRAQKGATVMSLSKKEFLLVKEALEDSRSWEEENKK